MSKVGGSIISEFYSAEFTNAVPSAMSASDVVIRGEGHHRPKLKCRVGEFSSIFPSILQNMSQEVKLADEKFKTYVVLYNQFHELWSQIFDFCLDLLTIANVAEQHEVWDFLSASSKNFFSTLMMFMQNYDHKKVLKQKDVIGWRKANDYEKLLAVLRRNFINVDDAVDDIVHQFKGVSDGLMRKVLGSPSSSYEPTTCTSDRHLSWNVEEINKLASTQSTSESVNSFSDNDDSDKDGNHGQEEVGPSSEANGLHSGNELNSKEFPPSGGVKRDEELISSATDLKSGSGLRRESSSSGGFPETSLAVVPSQQEDPVGVPPEVSLSSSSPFSTSCLSVRWCSPTSLNIPRAVWNPPLTRRGSPQPECAARVGVSESDTPQDI
ncbi:hypothetical protein CQW23_20817 [Capsicum baccatum]|uniref:Uncharacterized protein n=1 Tax=Capsicum baccatum TaxID=33114 RepID=A0A2G2W9P9_CAPBA|nr:hypothetical protein CQW23_20817 [Capsicum baccatum]